MKVMGWGISAGSAATSACCTLGDWRLSGAGRCCSSLLWGGRLLKREIPRLVAALSARTQAAASSALGKRKVY